MAQFIPEFTHDEEDKAKTIPVLGGAIVLRKKRKPAMLQERLFYLHITKAGGSTLRAIIEKQYSGKFFSMYDAPQPNYKKLRIFYNRDENDWKKITVIGGHLFFGQHAAFPQKKFKYITMLRKPLDRIISHYYYRKSRSADDQLRLYKLIKSGMTLKDVIEAGEVNHWVNEQCMVIAGVRDFSRAYDSEILEIAKLHLKNFFTVGLTEKFGKSVEQFSKILGWTRTTTTHRKLNVTPSRPKTNEIDFETVQAVDTITELDRQLYLYAEELFEQQGR